jgi:hypothetical protein
MKNQWSEIYSDDLGSKYYIDFSTFCKGPKAFAWFLKNLAEPLDEVSAAHRIKSWTFFYEVLRDHGRVRLRVRSGFTRRMGKGDCVWSQGQRMGELDTKPIYELDEIRSGSFEEVVLKVAKLTCEQRE